MKKITSLQKIICHKMKKTIEQVNSLQSDQLPPEAQSKLNKFESKYTHFENLGNIAPNLVQSKELDQIASYDMQ